MRRSQALLKSARAVAIGFAAATAVSGAVYVARQHLIAAPPGHVPEEWTVQTRALSAIAANEPAHREAETLRKALETLVTKDTDLHTKSEDWLAGYADLLRRLGLSLAKINVDEASDVLRVAATIPFGTPDLRAKAAFAQYQLQGSFESLLEAAKLLNPAQDAKVTNFDKVIPPATIPQSLATIYFEIGGILVARKEYERVLNLFLRVHRAIPPEEDNLCIRPAAAGSIGQIVWQLGDHTAARKWMSNSIEGTFDCASAACRDTRKFAKAILARME